jgi:hypothetical protein
MRRPISLTSPWRLAFVVGLLVVALWLALAAGAGNGLQPWPSAGDGDPDELAVLGSAEGELAAGRGQAVPMVQGDELVRFSQVKWDGLHASIYGGSPIIPCRSERGRG